MGTWGTGIFDDDTAGDTRDAFEDELSRGADGADAARRVLVKFVADLDDEDEGSIIYLALAALQLEHGTASEGIRRRALEIIDTGVDLHRWEEAGSTKLSQRKQVLENLRVQLDQ
ncbi:MAG: DUF4259 domain-containing protein [Chloroflexi bacterium]|nr:DUF4259 domain-containing protein [Chloroflexota bacterium]